MKATLYNASAGWYSYSVAVRNLRYMVLLVLRFHGLQLFLLYWLVFLVNPVGYQPIRLADLGSRVIHSNLVLWIKMGVKSKTIHSLSQALGTGVVFLELQLSY